MGRRHLYRVEVGSRDPVSVTMSFAGWPAVQGRLCDATAWGVGLSIAAGIPIPAPLGTKVEITFWLLKESRAVTLVGRVAGCQEVTDGRRLGIVFQDPSTASEELARLLGRVFNRRHAVRVAPEIGTRVALRSVVMAVPQPVEASVYCVSASGLGVAFRPRDGARVGGWDRIYMDLKVYPDDPPIRLRATIRHSTPWSGRIFCGLVVSDLKPVADAESSTEGAKDLERLRAYVDSRREELMGPAPPKVA